MDMKTIQAANGDAHYLEGETRKGVRLGQWGDANKSSVQDMFYLR